MSSPFIRSALLFALVVLAVAPARAEEETFFDRLRALCGERLEGRTEFPTQADHPMVGKTLVLTPVCSKDDEVRVPLAVGEDRSRTWIIRQEKEGLYLKHDHRHADGTPDKVTNYGGQAQADGTAVRQVFPADQETAELLPEAATNVWTLEFHPERNELSYTLHRHGELRYRAVFRLPAKKNSAGGGDRTHTPLREPDFESGASASSATPARSWHTVPHRPFRAS